MPRRTKTPPKADTHHRMMAATPHLDTQAVHAGELPDETFRPVATPIYRATTYGLDERTYALVKKVSRTEDPHGVVTEADLDAMRGRIYYARDASPNTAVVERKMAAMEGCAAAVAAASGMGAITAALLSLIQGKRSIVSTPHVYGGAYAFIYHELPRMFGIQVIDLDEFLSWRSRGSNKRTVPASPKHPSRKRGSDPNETTSRGQTPFSPKGRQSIAAIYLETLSNPFLLLGPLDEVVAARDACCPGVPIVADNTFLTPANFRPFSVLDPARDLVCYSGTKYLGGHSDVVAGLVCGSTAAITKVWEKIALYGACLDPEAAYYLERGLKTLAVRMERHNRNLVAVFDYLASVADQFALDLLHPLAGGGDIPAFARDLVRDARLGGMLTLNLRGRSERDGIRFMQALDRTGVFKHATSLGGVESLVSMPYNMSQPHPVQQRLIGLTDYDCIVRLSLGIEDPADLIAALAAALSEI
jgi:cystathionine beta-lyase/cystathionine gamma-synthase